MTVHARRTRTLLLLFAALVAVGLAVWIFQAERSEQVVENTPSEVVAPPLEGTEWVWRRSDHADGLPAVPAGEQFLLEFSADGTLTSTTDCNRMGGTYVRDGEVLSLGSFVSTKMYCEGSLEQVYADDLALVSAHTIEDNRLTLILNRDVGMMYFTAKE